MLRENLSVTLCGALLACATEANAPPAATSWSGSANAGGFGASLYLVADLDRFKAAWDTLGEHAKFDMTSSVQIGASVEAVIIFWGCSPDAAGSCALFSELSVLAADGSPVMSGSPMPVWSGKPPPPQGLLAVGETAATIKPTAEAAEFRVQSIITDRV